VFEEPVVSLSLFKIYHCCDYWQNQSGTATIWVRRKRLDRANNKLGKVAAAYIIFTYQPVNQSILVP